MLISKQNGMKQFPNNLSYLFLYSLKEHECFDPLVIRHNFVVFA